MQIHDSCSLVGYLRLVAEETDDGQAMQPIIFEHAKSGRSKCKGCGQKILNHELRYGQLVSHPYRNIDFYKYYHISCVECVGSDAVIEDDIGFCRICYSDFSEPSVILKCDDFMEHVHLKCCADMWKNTNCPIVDVTQFSDFENLSNADQEKMRRAFASENDPAPDDDDDDEIEVVGTKEGAAAVAGSTFLGHDLQESRREFEEAEKSGNIISLVDDEDEPDGNKSTAKQQGSGDGSYKEIIIKGHRFPSDSEDDDDDDDDNNATAAAAIEGSSRNIILIDDDDDDDDDDDEDNNMSSVATGSTSRPTRRNHATRIVRPSRAGIRRRTSLSVNLSVNRTRSRRRRGSPGIRQLKRRLSTGKRRRLRK